MDWFDSLKEKADSLVNDAMNAGSEAADKIKATAFDALDASSAALDSVKATASETADSIKKAYDESTLLDDARQSLTQFSDSVSNTASEIADATSTFIVTKIREMLSGINFDETKESVLKVGKEKDIDVSKLIEFIDSIKQFTEDGNNGNKE